MNRLRSAPHVDEFGNSRRRVSGAIVVAFLGLMVGFAGSAHSVTAQEREGGRSAEAEAGQRRSAEAEAGTRRSAEAEAGVRRSAEGEAGRRRSAEDVRDREGSGETSGTLRGFKPQTDREAALFQMVVQLQREVAALRREVQARGRDGERRAVVPRDGDSREQERGMIRDRNVDRDTSSGYEGFTLPTNWQRTKEGRVFQAYDKNRDEIVTLDEWLAMTNGNINAERRAISTRYFELAEPSGDGKFTPAEFIWWRKIGSQQGQRRDVAVPARGPRDGEGARRGPRDGEGERRGPRDGEGERRGLRDAERETGTVRGDRQ